MRDQQQCRVLQVARVACLPDGSGCRFDPAQCCTSVLNSALGGGIMVRTFSAVSAVRASFFDRCSAGEAQHHALRLDALALEPDRRRGIEEACHYPPQPSQGRIRQKDASTLDAWVEALRRRNSISI